MKDHRPEPASGDFSTTPLGDGLTLVAWMSLLLGLGAGGGALFAPDAWYAACLLYTSPSPRDS